MKHLSLFVALALGSTSSILAQGYLFGTGPAPMRTQQLTRTRPVAPPSAANAPTFEDLRVGSLSSHPANQTAPDVGIRVDLAEGLAGCDQRSMRAAPGSYPGMDLVVFQIFEHTLNGKARPEPLSPEKVEAYMPTFLETLDRAQYVDSTAYECVGDWARSRRDEFGSQAFAGRSPELTRSYFNFFDRLSQVLGGTADLRAQAARDLLDSHL